ncbi:MAG: type II secretion system protein [Pseudobdellovibrionaceae bacterium]|jgi:general secretion pathway protein I
MNRKGFTLIEVMMAIVIMASTLILLANSWSGAFNRLRKTQNNFEVAALLERKMAEIELQYRGKSTDEIPELLEDGFGDDYPQYRWKMESSKLEFPDMSSLIPESPGGQTELLPSIIRQMGEAISNSVKEVRVTVLFTPPDTTKTLTYSVTTYFVDYDKEVPLTMPSGGP